MNHKALLLCVMVALATVTVPIYADDDSEQSSTGYVRQQIQNAENFMDACFEAGKGLLGAWYEGLTDYFMFPGLGIFKGGAEGFTDGIRSLIQGVIDVGITFLDDAHQIPLDFYKEHDTTRAAAPVLALITLVIEMYVLSLLLFGIGGKVITMAYPAGTYTRLKRKVGL